jgi:hypothetical protein
MGATPKGGEKWLLVRGTSLDGRTAKIMRRTTTDAVRQKQNQVCNDQKQRHAIAALPDGPGSAIPPLESTSASRR